MSDPNAWLFEYISLKFQFYLSELKALSISTDLISYVALFLGLIMGIYLLRKILNIRSSLSEDSVLLELTPPAFSEKTAYTTQQLFSVLHDELKRDKPLKDRLLGKKTRFSFEIVSTLTQGIRYFVRVTPDEVSNTKKYILSYLPQAQVRIANEYLPQNTKKAEDYQTKVVEFKLKKHFAYPLQRKEMLEEHDPVAYITGMMTKLSPGELISFQIVLSPTEVKETNKLSNMILRNEDVLKYLNKTRYPSFIKPITLALRLFSYIVVNGGGFILEMISDIASPSKPKPALAYQYTSQLQILQREKPARVLSSFEQEAIQSVQNKIDQSLFETTIRLLVVVKDKKEQRERIRGFSSSLASFSVPKYQSLGRRYNFPPIFIDKLRLFNFQKRLLSLVSDSGPSLLSVSEIASLYHFPFSRSNQTENIVKSNSNELPASLSLKQGRDLSVVFGTNSYGGVETPIGLTNEERKTHIYIIGRTGGGKTTLMSAMGVADIQKGAGLAFIDPDGDVSEALLASVPEARLDDVVYFNPIDMKYPIGINLLELTEGLEDDEADLEKEVVAEGVISLFRKVFSKDENENAHRIEYILRNTIFTAFTIPNRTIFTVYKLLNDPAYLKTAVSSLDDEFLKDFWKNEFGRAGDYQIVKMVGGVTAKIGRFLFSPIAKRILEQQKSTINFSDILNGKILICNLSAGKLGDDTSKLLGTTILTKLQQAALRRANIPESKRKQFHLYVDEFQDFATLSFAKMLSRLRKYGVDICMAEQSTSQQTDQSIVKIILANVTTMICFRTGNPEDEELMLAQFSPYVEKGEIMNLPRYKFYIKISATNSEQAFSGETIKLTIKRNAKLIQKLIESSRKNWAITYVRTKKNVVVRTVSSSEEKSEIKTENVTTKRGFPQKKRLK